MAYFTESYFKNYTVILNESQRTFSSRAESDMNTKFDIFVSYNIKDKKIIEGVYNKLTAMGFNVYVDFIVDKQLNRNSVDFKTAKTIQRRLFNSKSLLYALSPNASMSKWMPWELGMVDGNTRKCAILPIVANSNDSYARQEYLLLYPIIEEGLNNSVVVNYKSIYANNETLRDFVNK